VLEAHDLHGPFGFENSIAEGIARKLASKLDALLIPVVKYGNCDT
jgi:creatinine amidohydrolase/Fe(II)-dependent formamide hydrolase-like protein